MVAVRISNNLEMFAVKVRVVNKRYKSGLLQSVGISVSSIRGLVVSVEGSI
jgi:hypothetical protein